MSSRDLILNKIKASLKNTSHVPDDPDVDDKIAQGLKTLTPDSVDGLAQQFQNELEIVAGEFKSVKSASDALPIVRSIFAETKFDSFTATTGVLPTQVVDALKSEFTFHSSEHAENRKTRLAAADIGIVDVDFAVAESGSLAVSFRKLNSTLPHFLPDVIIALVYKDQLLANLYELFDAIDVESAKDMTLITGPSRTADIEKILILGAHGPRRLVVIMIDER